MLALTTTLVGITFGSTAPARAQQQAKGFGVDRLYTAAPGGGWVVMDALDMRGGLGGGAAASFAYAHDSLRVQTSDRLRRLAVVSDQASANFGFAATYDRFRVYFDMTAPLVIKGDGGTVGAYHFDAPDVDLSARPDTLADTRVGVDARLVGEPSGRFRFGIGAQLFIPSGKREDYASDGSYRAMGRALFAGDFGLFTYAGHLGVHLRPLDDFPTPGSPRGSEFLFGAAGGAKLSVCGGGATVVIVGPEIYGATAFGAFASEAATAVEALLSGRIEGTGDDGALARVKLGVGAGLNRHLGAAEWRSLLSIEIFDHHADRDGDGVSDNADACPDTPGIRTTDRKTDGCPADRDLDGIPDLQDACPDERGRSTTDPRTAGCPTQANDDGGKNSPGDESSTDHAVAP